MVQVCLVKFYFTYLQLYVFPRHKTTLTTRRFDSAHIIQVQRNQNGFYAVKSSAAVTIKPSQESIRLEENSGPASYMRLNL
jgi:hypothetical protein